MTGDLFQHDGSRKYLTQDERQAFLTAAAQFHHTVRSFCHVLTYTAWRHVKAVMQVSGIRGAQASPKGLRHGFGVAAVHAGVPLHLVQRWLGHAQLSTTAIYAEVVGQEEHDIAARMWR